MGFTRKLQYFLVHQLGYSNKTAKQLIENGAVKLNDTVTTANTVISDSDKIEVNNKEVRSEKKHLYIKYYKPVGLVSSLNPLVKDSLYDVFKHCLPLSIAGRLDKYSEGLLILTTNGKWQQSLVSPSAGKEKEYIVRVDLMIDEAFLQKMAGGLDIGIAKTQNCTCYKIESDVFGIILTEGKNKQIRRMCKTLGYSVLNLKRIRISTFKLDDMEPGEMLNF